MRRLEKPIVCAVNGIAAGAGANMALACDLVLAADSASFLQAFVKIGLIPDTGGTFFLPRLIGPARAASLMMLGNKLGAQQAKDWGMIHDVVPAATLMETATALARDLATQPTRALGLTKRAINSALANDLESQLALEADLQRVAGRTADYKEGVRAFQEKRRPTFTGR
jgi:2-(1,2-epoxy-1,2-dihydrophenyl)acetyl-CoA isomerase